MSNLRVDNFSNRDGSAGSITGLALVQGVAKAWFNLNGTGTITERDSFNVSSYVDNGTGDYTVNFSIARPNANYSASLGVNGESASSTIHYAFTRSGWVYVPATTSAFRWLVTTGSFADADRSHNTGVIHGDPH